MPGTDPAQACQVVFGELPDLPFLPELPERGPGADITGRTAALLVDMPVQVTTGGWKLAERPGRDLVRAAGYLSHDLDALEETATGYTGLLKVQACGPVTLAATLELTRSLEPALSDAGALADLSTSLAEGIAAHLAQLRMRIPGAALVLQLDEPSLPAALAGRVRTASGLNLVRALDQAVARQRLDTVLSAAGEAAGTVIHCCASDVPFTLIAQSGASAASFDLDRLRTRDIDLIAECCEGGMGMFVGALPTQAVGRLTAGPPLPARHTAELVTRLWRRTGLGADVMAARLVVTPACGLAGVSARQARAALAHCREAARIAAEMIEESRR
jgi:methionine synthase II (cobalamin-independent)